MLERKKKRREGGDGRLYNTGVCQAFESCEDIFMNEWSMSSYMSSHP